MLSPQQIYKIITGADNGIDGYKIPKMYFDSAAVARDRDLLKQSSSGKTHKKYETRRGNYLEDYVRPFKSNPSPAQYQELKLKSKSTTKLNYPRKQSIFEEIYEKEKKKKQPYVGSYDLTKSLVQLEKEKKAYAQKKINYADKPNPFDNDMAHSELSPGPGQYNPRPILPKISPNPMKPKDWIQKHKKKAKQESLPSVGTYTPISNDSFAKIQTTSPTKRPYWGSDKRFAGLWQSAVSPGPGTYKQLEKQLISKGIDQSIYF